MSIENSEGKKEEISGRELSEYIQTMGISISVLALVSSFVYTALTLILIGVEDVSALLWQGALLALYISFTLLLFLTYMHLGKILVTRARAYPRRPRWPQARVLNLLEALALSLWWISITFMFLAKNLIYLALTSLIAMTVMFPVSYLLILKTVLRKENAK